jgi:hypothetical protein
MRSGFFWISACLRKYLNAEHAAAQYKERNVDFEEASLHVSAISVNAYLIHIPRSHPLVDDYFVTKSVLIYTNFY